MDKKQLQQLIVILPVILVAGVFGYYKYLLAPLNKQKAELSAELGRIREEYKQSKSQADRLPRLEQEIIGLNQEIREMQRKLPPTKDVPGLIRLLAQKMDAHRILWTRLDPGNQVQQDYYIEHSYKIPFTSSYHDLAKFLTEVGQMERIFATRFSALRPAAQTNGPTLITGDLVFLIYTSK